MVQMRVITKTSGISKALKEIPDQVDQIKRDILEQMAADIALNSPVWSGEYVTSHQIGLRSGSFTARATRESDKKVDNPDQKRQEGFERLLSQVASVNIKSENFVFRNPLFYASIVEGNYGVYAQARKKAAQAVQAAVQRARR